LQQQQPQQTSVRSSNHLQKHQNSLACNHANYSIMLGQPTSMMLKVFGQ
jgi:hypothetical protein